MANKEISSSGRHLAPRRRRGPSALLWATGILLVLALGVGGFLAFYNERPTSVACPGGSLRLQVAAAPDQSDVLAQAAAEYGRQRATVDDRCVDVQVRGVESVEAAGALVSGWDEVALGPRPDVWVPASSAWALQVQLKRQATKQPDVIPFERPKVATTPMVFAMPRPMAQALGWPQRPLGWAELLEAVQSGQGWKAFNQPDWGPFRLGKLDPNLSTPGLEALIGAVFAVTRQGSDLSVETLARQADQLRTVILGLERAPGQDADTPATFLANLQQADQAGEALGFVSAVPLDEKSVFDYNRGSLGGLEDGGGQRPKPKVPLAAVYPKEGTLEADHPWVVLRVPWVDAAKRRAAAGFLDYIRSEPVQTRFQQAGFRSWRGRPGPALNEESGLLPDQPARVLAPPAPTVVAAALESWNAARKRSNVLAVFDVSGSMKEEVPGTGRTKMDLVKQAAAQGLAYFAAETNLGSWVFATDLGAGKDWREDVPIGPTNAKLPNGQTRRQAMVAALSTMQATNQDTGLYDTTLAAFRAVKRSYATGRLNLVVLLTDGINDDPGGGISKQELLSRLKAEQGNQKVAIITIAFGANADAASLRQISQATGGIPYVVRDPREIVRVFTEVIRKLPVG